MTTTGFNAWQYTAECERLLAAGSLDKEIDRVAAAVERRKDELRKLRGLIGKGNEHYYTGQAASQTLVRSVEFAAGDLAVVESLSATYRTFGIVGRVARVNDKTLWLVEAPGVLFPVMRRTGMRHAKDWQDSDLTKFQKLKGFKVPIEHCAHHTTP